MIAERKHMFVKVAVKDIQSKTENVLKGEWEHSGSRKGKRKGKNILFDTVFHLGKALRTNHGYARRRALGRSVWQIRRSEEELNENALEDAAWVLDTTRSTLNVLCWVHLGSADLHEVFWYRSVRDATGLEPANEGETGNVELRHSRSAFSRATQWDKVLTPAGFSPQQSQKGDRDGNTALHICAWEGLTAAAVDIIFNAEDRSQLDVQNTTGVTPMGYACMNNNIEIIRLLADAGVNLEQQLDALWRASERNNKEAVRAMYEVGANFEPALQLAAKMKRVKQLHMMMESAELSDATLKVIENWDNKLRDQLFSDVDQRLWYAARAGWPDVVRDCVANPSDEWPTQTDCERILNILKFWSKSDVFRVNGKTPLEVAIKYRRWDCAEEISYTMTTLHKIKRVVSVVIPLVDTGSDVLVTITWYTSEPSHYWWAAISSVLIMSSSTMQASVGMRRGPLAAFLYFIGFGSIYEATIDEGGDPDKDEVNNLKMLEAVVESVPQVCLQGYGLLNVMSVEGEKQRNNNTTLLLSFAVSISSASHGLVSFWTTDNRDGMPWNYLRGAPVKPTTIVFAFDTIGRSGPLSALFANISGHRVSLVSRMLAAIMIFLLEVFLLFFRQTLHNILTLMMKAVQAEKDAKDAKRQEKERLLEEAATYQDAVSKWLTALIPSLFINISGCWEEMVFRFLSGVGIMLYVQANPVEGADSKLDSIYKLIMFALIVSNVGWVYLLIVLPWMASSSDDGGSSDEDDAGVKNGDDTTSLIVQGAGDEMEEKMDEVVKPL